MPGGADATADAASADEEWPMLPEGDSDDDQFLAGVPKALQPAWEYDMMRDDEDDENDDNSDNEEDENIEKMVRVRSLRLPGLKLPPVEEENALPLAVLEEERSTRVDDGESCDMRRTERTTTHEGVSWASEADDQLLSVDYGDTGRLTGNEALQDFRETARSTFQSEGGRSSWRSEDSEPVLRRTSTNGSIHSGMLLATLPTAPRPDGPRRSIGRSTSWMKCLRTNLKAADPPAFDVPDARIGVQDSIDMPTPRSARTARRTSQTGTAPIALPETLSARGARRPRAASEAQSLPVDMFATQRVLSMKASHASEPTPGLPVISTTDRRLPAGVASADAATGPGAIAATVGRLPPVERPPSACGSARAAISWLASRGGDRA